jgi:hypothetical protein
MDKKRFDDLERLLSGPDLTTDQRQKLVELLSGRSNSALRPTEERGVSAPQLDLTAFRRRGPQPKAIRVCLDFGTAMSKAWATGEGAIETLPLLIGKAAGGEGLTVPSSIFIGDNGRIYLGNESETQHRANIRVGRPRFDNLKRMLSEAEVNTDLGGVQLREGIDPTGSGLTGGDLLVLYFAWLTDLCEIALRDAVAATKGAISIGKADLRAVTRRFAIPCFESADGDQGRVRAAWAKALSFCERRSLPILYMENGAN